MQALAIFALFSLAAAKPSGNGVISSWGGAVSSLDLVHQPSLTVAQPLVQSAPVFSHAAPAATSYSSFQRVVHPTSLAQPLIQAAQIVSQPLVQTPIVSQRVVQATPFVSQPIVQAPIVSQRLVQATPVISEPIVQAPVVSQRIVQASPVVSQPIVQTPVVSQPIVQNPILSQRLVQAEPLIQTYAQSYAHAQPLVHSVSPFHSPLVQTVARPSYLQNLVSVNAEGHGW